MTSMHESYIMIKTPCIKLPFFWLSWIKTSSFADKTQVLQSTDLGSDPSFPLTSCVILGKSVHTLRSTFPYARYGIQ